MKKGPENIRALVYGGAVGDANSRLLSEPVSVCLRKSPSFSIPPGYRRPEKEGEKTKPNLGELYVPVGDAPITFSKLSPTFSEGAASRLPIIWITRPCNSSQSAFADATAILSWSSSTV